MITQNIIAVPNVVPLILAFVIVVSGGWVLFRIIWK